MAFVLSRRWAGPGGYGEVLKVGFPLVLSMASTTIMQFTDRIFLGHYSLESLAAVMPATAVSFLLMSFFMGTAEYVSVFVAQYTGAARPERVGAALWQGIWFCVLAWAVLALFGLLAETIFTLAGHEPHLIPLEAAYFRIASLGAGIGVMGVCISAFFSGRGITIPVMVANMLGAAVNIPLDYALINGAWGMPELGIVGAAWATVVGWCVTLAAICFMAFRRENESCFKVRSSWRPERDLLMRLFRYGLPGGLQFFIDMFAISFFILMVGRLGTLELAATNIAISINLLSFLPLVGFAIAVSVLVGQAIGRGKPEQAARAMFSGLHICYALILVFSAIYILFPEFLYGLFQTPASDAGAGDDFQAITAIGRKLLLFVALYSLVDVPALVILSALKGAGDSRFVMFIMLFCSVTTILAPIIILLRWFDPGIFDLWWCISFYAFSLASLSFLRFSQGKWRSMRVIEAPAPVPGGPPPAT